MLEALILRWHRESPSLVRGGVPRWAGLRSAVGPAWCALFRRPPAREFALALVAVPLMVGLSALVAPVCSAHRASLPTPVWMPWRSWLRRKWSGGLRWSLCS